MATDETLIVHPGDIIQGTVQGPQHGHLFLVTETHTRHLGAVARAFINGADQEVYHRFRPGTFAVVGSAAILPPEVTAARRDSLDTQRQLEAERRAAVPPQSDDLTPWWDVEVRFNGRTTGSGQRHYQRVQADSAEEAMDRVQLPVMQHGGSICITGWTVDEVKRPAPQVDYYEQRHTLQQGQCFRTREGGIVELDRQVPGDATKWYVLDVDVQGGRAAYDSTIEPGDLVQREQEWER